MDTHSPRTPRWRRYAGVLLLVLGCVALVAASLAIWLERDFVETDGYVETVRTLPSDPDVADALSEFLVREVVAETDAEAALTDALSENLGPRGAGISRVLASSIEVATTRAIAEVVASDEFEVLWAEANGEAHRLGIAVIEGDSDAVATRDGRVELDLGPLMTRVVERVEQTAGVTIEVPADAGRVELFQEDELEPVQQGLNLLKTLSWVLPIVALILLAAVIALARHRWRAAMHVGIGVMIVALVMAVALRFLRVEVRDAATTENLSEGAVDAIWRAITDGLRDQTWTLFILGAILALGAALMGGAKWGPDARRAILGKVRGTDMGPLARYAREYTGLAYGAGVVAGFLALLLWPSPNLWIALVITVLVVLYLLLVRHLAGSGDTESARA